MFPFPAFLPSALGNRHSAIRLSVKNSCNPCLPSDFGLRISFGLRPSDFRSHRPSPIRPFDVGCWMLDVPLPPLPPIGNPAIRLSSQSQRDCIPKPSAPRATLGHILQNVPNPERVASPAPASRHPTTPGPRMFALRVPETNAECPKRKRTCCLSSLLHRGRAQMSAEGQANGTNNRQQPDGFNGAALR